MAFGLQACGMYAWDITSRIKRPQPQRLGSSYKRPKRSRLQNSAGRYPLISRPMQISTSVGVLQVISVSLRAMPSNLAPFSFE